jgi:acetylornithine/N-succinyldiaminopimelate aminotransferase
MEQENTQLMETYNRLPTSFVRGSGAWLWDDQGNRFLDALGGIAVAALGHAHAALADALADQARTLIHTSNLYRIPLQEELARELCSLSGMSRSFFCNSGAEANEGAIKIARRYGHGKKIQVPCVLVTEGSFHGRTMATLTATGNRKAHAGFEPLVAGFKRVPFNDLEAISLVAGSDPDIVAVLVEPVQGEGGVIIPSQGYLAGLRELCDTHGWLLMVDEIQTGMGRTGKWFAFQHEGIQPDVITVAKALGNGIPIGACLAPGAAGEMLTAGSHGTTFGGNPFACRAALTVIDEIKGNNLVARAGELGTRILNGLCEQLSADQGIRSIRGMGLMIALEFDKPCTELVSLAMDQGLLINVTAENVVRLLPPLILKDEEADLLVQKLVTIIRSRG